MLRRDQRTGLEKLARAMQKPSLQAVPKRQFKHPLVLTEEGEPPAFLQKASPQPLRLRDFAELSSSHIMREPVQSFVPQISKQPVVPAAQARKLALLPRLQKQKKTTRQKRRRWRRLFIAISLLTILAVGLLSQANSQGGAWTADVLRAALGPTITARIESWYLGLSDTTHQIQYNLSGHHVNPPWAVSAPPSTPVPPPKNAPLAPMPLPHIPVTVLPALTGEGAWFTQGNAPSPYNYLPIAAKAFIRPDPTHPYAIATLLQFDMRFIHLHMVAGTSEPGGPRGIPGPGVIPAADQSSNILLAAFNGGFKYADGQYGMKTGGIIYVPPQNGVATIAIMKNGSIIMGAWGIDPRLNNANPDLVAWRQNAALLIDTSKINPLTNDGWAWGGTILNSAYTWRSGIGITAQGTLIYAAGASLTAATLGKALLAAGAITAMQTDINPYWVRAFLYNPGANNALTIVKLNPYMQGSGWEYLNGMARDFFYLTRYAPPLPSPPKPVKSRTTYAQ